ncbi:hypothetical protein GCM10027273_33550 [Nocardioides pakistanensis]
MPSGGSDEHVTRRMQVAVRWWPWVLALLVTAPLLAPGYVLSYDMVFVPDLGMRSDFLGLGTSLPRAVPSDALVAVVDEVVPGMLLQKLVLVGALVVAGAGARRLVPADSGVAQLAATSVYVWNPYVAERLGIGHWPVLLAYAALPWVFDRARRLRLGEPGNLPALVGWLALAATSAAGGLMAALVAVVAVAGRGSTALRTTSWVAGAAVAVNAPWLVAGLARGGDAVTDPDSVAAFAAGGEGPLPVPLSLLGLGGIWNDEVVPASRLGWAAVAALVATVAVCAVGWRRWSSYLPGRDRATLLLAGAAGLLVAMAGALAQPVLEWIVAEVPGGGLFRDGSRYLALLAPVEAALFGAGAAVLTQVRLERPGRIALAGGAVLMPLALMPDLAWGLGGALRPVAFPDDYAAARAVLADRSAERDGVVVVLPFSSYRLPEWNLGRRTLDPVGRYLTPNYVANDELSVSGKLLAGEDPRARRIADLLGQRLPEPGLVAALAAEGVSWVVVDVEARAALEEVLDTPELDGRRLLLDTPHLQVYELPEAPARPGPGAAAVVAQVLAWLVALGSVAAALAAGSVASARSWAKTRS